MVARKTVKTKRKSPTARVKGYKPRQESPGQDKQRWVEGILMILLGIYFYYAFITAQPSLVDKVIGKFILMYLFGNSVPILCLILIATGVLYMLNKYQDYKETIMYVILLSINYMVFLSLYIPNLNINYKIVDLFTLAGYGGYGGIVGIMLAYLLNGLLTRTGAAIFMILLTLVEIFMILRNRYPNLYARIIDSDFGLLFLKNKFLDLSDDLAQKRAVREERRKSQLKEEDTAELNINEEEAVLYPVSDSVGLMQRENTKEEPKDFFDTVESVPWDDIDEDELEETVKTETRNDSSALDAYMFGSSEEPNAKASQDQEVLKATDSFDLIAPELIGGQTEGEQERFKFKEESDYKLPSIELLTKSSLKSKIDEKEIKENAARIKETLNNFGVDATIRNYECGPSITRFEVKPAPGVKVSKIVNLNDDLALALATSDIRIEAPIPGKDAIGIEVPNKKSDIVHLREIIDSPEFNHTKNTLPFSVGKTLSGHNIIGDISSMPHLLIAGSTGSGKSVCINSIIISLLYHESPQELKMIMIDPKMVELNQYNAIPHLLIPVVTDPQKAAGALNWAIDEMEGRYNLFSETGVRDLESYNELMKRSGEDTLPRIVIIIDELADLMMTSPKEVEAAICRIAQKARACGIHLLIATQRPSVDVITGLIKSNIPSRIAFAVASNTDSRTILDTAGAEKLLGRGDMLYKPVGLSKPLRVQCSYVSDSEITRVIEAIQTDEEPDFDESINETITQHIEEKKKKDKNEKRDELYDEAVEVAFVNNQVSTSMLQRRLGIGYARAGRLIDSLEKDGIISGPNGSKPRKLLVTRNEYMSDAQ